MKLRIFVSLVAALTFLGISAHAQDSTKFDAGLGYSYAHLNPGGGADDANANGGVGYFAYNFNNTFAVVSSFAGYTVSGNNYDTTAYTYLFGPRISWHHDGKVVPFAHVLFGGAHTSFGIASQNAFAMSLGMGIDLKVTHHLYIRPIEADYLYTHFSHGTDTSQNNLALETGLVFHF